MRIHLGCGTHIIPGFDNLDAHPALGGIVCDLRQGLQYPDNSVDFIFSEHFLEHIERDQGLLLIQECYRVLKIGGTIRTTVPDLRFVVDDYLAGKIDRYPGAWEPRTPCAMLNECMGEWAHRFMYDISELKLLHEEAGFKDIKEAAHGKYECRGHSTEIVVEGTKCT